MATIAGYSADSAYESKAYAEMHPALATFDSAEPDLIDFVQMG